MSLAQFGKDGAVVMSAKVSFESESQVQPLSTDYDTRKTRAPTICGLRRIVVLGIAALLLLGLGLGIGLGVGLQSKSSDAAVSPSATAAASFLLSTSKLPSAPATSILSVRTTFSTSTISSTSTASAPAASGTASTSCPATNGTTYVASGHTFLILCENDIQAPNKVDLGRVYQPTFNACIESCAALGGNKRSDISAVYWVDYNAEQTGTCWCFGGTSRSDGAYVSNWAANNLAWIQS